MEKVQSCVVADGADLKSCHMQKFRLYETRSKFYLIGRGKNRSFWRVLKIDRLEPSELNITEDSTVYSETDCCDLLGRIHEGNKSTGGLKFVTTCYGIIGFIKFLEPYYMLLITKRRKIGTICGHTIYAITKSEMVPIPHAIVRSKMTYSKDENRGNLHCCYDVHVTFLSETRYKKLLCSVDLTKDFFFSYSYNVMLSLQKNLSDHNTTGKSLYETLFVWNEFLTRGIRNNLQNTSWTVALVYGFFKQLSCIGKIIPADHIEGLINLIYEVFLTSYNAGSLLMVPVASSLPLTAPEKMVNLSISGREFNLTIIARRSRHYAGTRYLKRGVNEKGRVANDVETEQIVFADAQDGCPMQISSVVQNRGSIPLFWSQEASPLNLKPDIILSKKDHNYEATRLHFENLIKRYGNPIIILNLIKTREKKPRETILRTEFTNAVRSINKNLRGENRLRFLHWDLNRHSRCSKATNVLSQLGKVAAYALKLTGIFYCPVTPNLRLKGLLYYSYSEKNNAIDHSIAEQASINKDNVDKETEVSDSYYSGDENKDYSVKPQMLQAGVLRTNCIDCLDRTNVAQYAYGLAALGRQLQVLGFFESPYIDLDNPLAKELMTIYESMGDTLAFQYGGSAAHNKIFSERRGQWKAAAQSQEFIRTLQRYYNNTYVDGDKQKAINIFLGYFQPQQGKPALWELDSDQHYTVGKGGPYLVVDNNRSTIKRSLSDGNILCESGTTIRRLSVTSCQQSSEKADKRCLSEPTPDIFTCGSEICHCRQIYGGMFKDQYCDGDHICYDEHGDACDCSNFLDVDWLSSSGTSCEEELLERSVAIMGSNLLTLEDIIKREGKHFKQRLANVKLSSQRSTSISSENIVNELITETTTSASESGSSMKGRQSGPEPNKGAKYTENFEQWVTNGELLFV